MKRMANKTIDIDKSYQVIKKAGNYKLIITEKQSGDPITIVLNKDDIDIKLLSYPYNNKQDMIIDISKAFKREYDN